MATGNKHGENESAAEELSSIILQHLGVIIEEVTGIEPSEVTPEKYFVDDLDIDSLSMIEIVVQAEDRYAVKVPDEDLAALRTVRLAQDYVLEFIRDHPQAAISIAEQHEPKAIKYIMVYAT